VEIKAIHATNKVSIKDSIRDFHCQNLIAISQRSGLEPLLHPFSDFTLTAGFTCEKR
jgi:hypothetical protein